VRIERGQVWSRFIELCHNGRYGRLSPSWLQQDGLMEVAV
jgi:hypothetical protein